MAFEELRENIKDQVLTRWEEFKESSAFINAREKYDDLTPNAQTFVKGFAAFFVVAIVSFIIYGFFSEASTKIADFEENKRVIREMLKLKRDIAQAPRISNPPPEGQLKSLVDSAVQSFNLDPTQVDEVTAQEFTRDPKSSLVPASVKQSGVLVSLKQLNLKQVVDIGFRLQNINSAAKLSGVDIRPNPQNDHYFDVMYTLIGYYPPEVEGTEEVAKPNNNRRSPRARSRSGRPSSPRERSPRTGRGRPGQPNPPGSN